MLHGDQNVERILEALLSMFAQTSKQQTPKQKQPVQESAQTSQKEKEKKLNEVKPKEKKQDTGQTEPIIEEKKGQTKVGQQAGGGPRVFIKGFIGGI